MQSTEAPPRHCVTSPSDPLTAQVCSTHIASDRCQNVLVIDVWASAVASGSWSGSALEEVKNFREVDGLATDGIVAHAFYPRDGRLHFDADEDWSLNSPHGVNLYQTAVHEIGHLLGLEHSVDPRAVMFAARRPYDPDFSLADDDVRAIRVLFPIGDVMSNHDHVEDSRATTSNDRNREMTVSQVVENLDGGPPPSQHAPEDELTFPFPLPRLGIAYTRNSAIL